MAHSVEEGDSSSEPAMEKTAQPARVKLAKIQREAKDARAQVQKLLAQVQQLQEENQQLQVDTAGHPPTQRGPANVLAAPIRHCHCSTGQQLTPLHRRCGAHPHVVPVVLTTACPLAARLQLHCSRRRSSLPSWPTGRR